MKASPRIASARLILRKPTPDDASEIFARYASDAEVTRWLSWPTHRSVDDTRAFLQFSDAEWDRWPAGPYLIESQADGLLLGSTGFSFETPYRAATGYVLAKDAWGHGYASEALDSIVGVADALGLRRLYALCHTEHRASARVLEKCGFQYEGTLRRHSAFPNLDEGEVCDVLCYAVTFD